MPVRTTASQFAANQSICNKEYYFVRYNKEKPAIIIHKESNLPVPLCAMQLSEGVRHQPFMAAQPRAYVWRSPRRRRLLSASALPPAQAVNLRCAFIRCTFSTASSVTPASYLDQQSSDPSQDNGSSYAALVTCWPARSGVTDLFQVPCQADLG